jgi:hypothetical protein
MRRALLAALVLALACGEPPAWNEPRALAPFLAALDRDGSGAVEEGEWTALSWAAPPFSEADRDGDGRLDSAELAALLRGQDPMEFDAARLEDLPPRARHRGPKRDPAMTQPSRHLLDLFGFLADEARAAGFTGGLPDEGEMRTAARTEDLTDPAVQDLLARYAQAWTEVGLAFPSGLPRTEVPAAGAPSP